MGVSDRIREAASIKGMNIKEFSEALGIAYRTVQNYLAEDRGVGSDFLTACSAKLGISATWLLTGMGDPLIDKRRPIGVSAESELREDFLRVPRLSIEVAAGDGFSMQDEDCTGFYAFNRKWLARRNLAPANLVVVAVRGDSMEPRLSGGDLILVDRAQRQIADGLAYVIRLGNDLLVKHVQRISADRISLISANTFYPPREVNLSEIDGQIEVIGRVVASMHEW